MLGTQHSVDISSGTIHYRTFGNGPKHVVFVHGWGGTSESWHVMWEQMQAQMGELLNEYTLFAIDLPGFGSSTPPPEPWNMDQYTAAVEETITAIGIHSPFSLVVHSFGGRIMLKMLSKQPELVTSVTALAIAGMQYTTAQKEFVRRSASGLKQLFMLPGIRVIFPAIRTLGYKLLRQGDYPQLDGVMKDTFTRVIKEDLTELIPQVTTPVHLFWGVNDGYVPVADGRYMHEHFPQATLTEFADAKHGILYTRAEEIVNEMQHYL